MLCLFGLIGAMAQTKTATGVVTDQAGETVIGASVIVKGTTNGSITDLDGKFTLGNVKDGDIIQISFVGYKTQEIKFAGQMLNVILHDDTEVLDEVEKEEEEWERFLRKLKQGIGQLKFARLPSHM